MILMAQNKFSIGQLLFIIIITSFSSVNGLPMPQKTSGYARNAGDDSTTVIEGDIKLTDVNPYSSINELWLRSAVTDKSKVWTNAVVPYYIDDTFFSTDEIVMIKAAMEEFHNKTCVQFIPKTTEMPYLYITPLSRCWSEIGMPLREGINTLSLGPACLEQKGTVIHELMHVLGFWHEQNRVDRDDYIAVNWDNIREGMEHNFYKYSEGKVDTLQEPYDYESIMHYSAFAFAKDPQVETILPKIPVMIGQRFGLSKLDIVKIKKLYGCSSKWSSSSALGTAALQKKPTIETRVPSLTTTPGNQQGGPEIIFPDLVTDLMPLPFKFDWSKTTPNIHSDIVFPNDG